MRLSSVTLPCILFSSVAFTLIPLSSAKSSTNDLAAQKESAGDLAGARALLEQEARNGSDTASLAAYAEFLDRHRAPERRDACVKWAQSAQDPAERRRAWRQVVLIDMMDGKTQQLAEDLRQYQAAGGPEFTLPARAARAVNPALTITIPGPLRSFARMAALTTDLAPEELLPALARNIVTNGYQALASNEALDQTEYLKLLIRYVGQARELEQMAGPNKKLVVPTCDSQQTADLLRILGYRMRGSCGSDLVLETVNATRAFITVDSGFPLAQLEQDLRINQPFEYGFAPTAIPVLFEPEYWMGATAKDKTNFIDAFLADPSLCRLYLGFSKLDTVTANAIRKQVPAARLKIYAHVLDFYGGMFQIRDGHAVVPGSAKAWSDLVDASPDNGAAFFEKLIVKDDGWMASYFDALSRLRGPATQYLTEPERLKRFYSALKGKITTPGPARPVFRSSTEMMLLTNGLRIDANGQAHIPGGVEVWRDLFAKHPHGKSDKKLKKAANSWQTSDDVLEGLFALCRRAVENEPLKIFLALNDIDRYRTTPLSPLLARRLARDYKQYSAQYSIFAEASDLSEAAITQYMDLMPSVTGIRDTLLRADALGSLQSLVGLWQILCRQNLIAPADQDKAFSSLIQPFAEAKKPTEVFDAGRNGIQLLLTNAHSSGSGLQQDRLLDLIAGRFVTQAEGRASSSAEEMLHIFDAQHLIPLDTLFTIADRLDRESTDSKAIRAFNSQLARIEEAQNLRSSLSSAEKNLLSFGYWSERHVDQERKVDFEKLLKDNDKKEARGALTPFLRDSLVGLLYAYYAPPGAQLIFTNPLLVRNHDFIGAQGLPMNWRATETQGNGWPASSGGRLMGSLSSLPYALAEAEQNFLIPSREQALIWGDLVPQIIVSAKVPRWFRASPVQLRWVGLHMRRGENLLAASTMQENLRKDVLRSLGHLASPPRIEKVDELLNTGRFQEVMATVLPSELYALATDPMLKNQFPDAASKELAALASSHPSETSPEKIAALFGTPKPTLTHSYRPALLHVRTFPTLMGYSSRILAETWESNNLYYAALADELAITPDQLDVLIPEWTRRTVENVFATHLEDWPALLRSLRKTGDDVRQRASQRASAQIGLRAVE